MAKNNVLPKEVARECFLFEAINFLMVGCAPVESTYDGEYDIRNCDELYCDELHPLDCDNNQFVNELLASEYGIHDPYFEGRFEEVNFHESIEKYDERLSWNLSQEMLQEVSKDRPLVLEYLKERDQYLMRLEDAEKPFKSILIKALKDGKLLGKGFLIRKYEKEEETFIDIDSDWYEKAVKIRVDGKTGVRYEYARNKDEKIEREEIPAKYWKMENVDFEESALVFSVGKDLYKYCFIILDFAEVYSAFPKELCYPIEAKLLGNKCIYDDKEFRSNQQRSKQETRDNLKRPEVIRWQNLNYEKSRIKSYVLKELSASLAKCKDHVAIKEKIEKDRRYNFGSYKLKGGVNKSFSDNLFYEVIKDALKQLGRTDLIKNYNSSKTKNKGL